MSKLIATALRDLAKAVHASMRRLTTTSLPLILIEEKIDIRATNQILHALRDLPIIMMITSPPQDHTHPRNVMTITRQVPNPHQAHTTATIATTIQITNPAKDPLQDHLPLIQMITSLVQKLMTMITTALTIIRIVLHINQRIVNALQIIIMARQRVTTVLQRVHIDLRVIMRAEVIEAIKIEKKIDIQANIK